MSRKWMQRPDEPVRVATPRERGDILIDLLELSDALPPLPHIPLDVPSFKERCGRH